MIRRIPAVKEYKKLKFAEHNSVFGIDEGC